MSKEVLERLSKASDLLNQACVEIEGAEAAMYQETGDFSKKAELVLGDIWRAKCGVNIMLQDWSMR